MNRRLLAYAAAAALLSPLSASAAWENWLQVHRFQITPIGQVVFYTRLPHQCGGTRVLADPGVSAEFHRMLLQTLIGYRESFGQVYFHALVTSCDGTFARITHLETAGGTPSGF
jgi:hypothetical protein